ncbi:MAG: efflux RND transporter periplasmic adaptor subunit [Candidatus Binataceae bacterium]|nr:efflux RND transporter periplasmic adaptor subunit [Candidatus Binataceae bacterium]
MTDTLTESRPGWSRQRALIAGAAAIALLWLLFRLLFGNLIEPGLLHEKAINVPERNLGRVLSQQVPLRYAVIGSIQSRVPIEAASRVTARVKAVTVRAGEHVTRGQIIVVLDRSQLAAQVAQAQGLLAAARAEMSRTQSDRKRFSELFARGSVTARENEAAEASFRSTAASVAQAQAGVAAARAELDYATVRSPVDGIVVERLTEPGGMAMPGQPLVRLYDEHALRVELEAPEELARSIEIGTPLQVGVDATGATYQTSVSEIVPAADPASRSFIVRAPLPSGNHLRPGMFARAAFTAGSENIITVPRDAIDQIGQLATVRVYTGRRIQTQMVSLGRGLGERREVLAGLQPGDRVILDHPDRVGH